MTLSQGLGSHWPEYAMEAAGLGVNERFTGWTTGEAVP